MGRRAGGQAGQAAYICDSTCCLTCARAGRGVRAAFCSLWIQARTCAPSAGSSRCTGTKGSGCERGKHKKLGGCGFEGKIAYYSPELILTSPSGLPCGYTSSRT